VHVLTTTACFSEHLSVRASTEPVSVHQLQRTREAPLELEDGRQLRVNWAHGQLPDWKVRRVAMHLGVMPLGMRSLQG
jgi:hypothetical protein